MPSPSRRPGLKVTSRAGTRTLYLRGTVRGRRIYESTGTDDPRLAEEARAQREAELYRAAVHGTRPQVTFAAAAISYLENEPHSDATALRLHKVIRYFGQGTTCDDVDQATLDRAAKAILRPGYAPATKLREVVTPIKAVLLHAARRRWCQVPVFEKIRGAKGRTEWLTPDQAEALIEAAAPWLQPLLAFLFCTGARLGEALALTWDDVDLQHGRATLRETKGRIGQKLDRLVLLPPRALAVLAALDHRGGAVFRSRFGEAYRLNKEGMPYGGQIKVAWAGACHRAGIKGELREYRQGARVKPQQRWLPVVSPHDTRHTWASWHYALHKDLLRLKHDGCWASVDQVERYAHLVPDGLVPQIRAFMESGAGVVQPMPAGRIKA